MRQDSSRLAKRPQCEIEHSGALSRRHGSHWRPGGAQGPLRGPAPASSLRPRRSLDRGRGQLASAASRMRYSQTVAACRSHHNADAAHVERSWMEGDAEERRPLLADPARPKKTPSRKDSYSALWNAVRRNSSGGAERSRPAWPRVRRAAPAVMLAQPPSFRLRRSSLSSSSRASAAFSSATTPPTSPSRFWCGTGGARARRPPHSLSSVPHARPVHRAQLQKRGAEQRAEGAGGVRGDAGRGGGRLHGRPLFRRLRPPLRNHPLRRPLPRRRAQDGHRHVAAGAGEGARHNRRRNRPCQHRRPRLHRRDVAQLHPRHAGRHVQHRDRRGHGAPPTSHPVLFLFPLPSRSLTCSTLDSHIPRSAGG